jgi:hypothetical protein
MDPDVWRIATPHWTDRRAAFLIDKAGRPGWREQWLNIWPGMNDESPADVWLSKSQMLTGSQAKVNPADGTVAQIAIELSDTHRAWAVAASWLNPLGQLVVTVEGGYGGLESALVVAKQWAERWAGGRVYAHQSVLSRMPPGFPAMVVAMKQSDAAAASSLFRDMVLAREVKHVGHILLDQVEHVVTRTLDGRESIDQSRSRGPVCAVKAVAWSCWATQLAGVEVAAIY